MGLCFIRGNVGVTTESALPFSQGQSSYSLLEKNSHLRMFSVPHPSRVIRIMLNEIEDSDLDSEQYQVLTADNGMAS